MSLPVNGFSQRLKRTQGSISAPSAFEATLAPEEVRRLVDAVGRLGLTFELAPRPGGWRFVELLVVKSGDERWEVPVDDEFGDLKSGRYGPVALHLVLATLNLFREAESEAEIRVEFSLESAEVSREIVGRVRAILPSLNRLLADLEPLEDWDWTMNTGVARALRDAADSD